MPCEALEYWLIAPEAQTVEVLSLERGEYQPVGRWQPEGQAASRLLQGFKVTARELSGSPVSLNGEDPFMPARFAILDRQTPMFLPYDLLKKISLRITNEVRGLNRVVLDLPSQPPGTMEWE